MRRAVARPERPPLYVRAYARVARPMVQHPWLGLVAAALLLGLGMGALRLVETGFLPEMDEGAFVLDYFLPAATSLNETDAAARKIEAVLRALPDVQTYSRRTGAELGPATATQVSRGDIMVRLVARGRRRSVEEVIDIARQQIAARVPEARVEFVQVLQDVLNDLSGTPRPIEIKIFGADYVVLRAKAQEVVARIHDVPGLVDLYGGFDGDAAELRVRLDPARAARLGLTSADLAADLDAGLRGTVAAVLRRPDRPIGVRVRYPDAFRFDPGQVQNFPVLAGTNGLTSIRAVADLQRVASPSLLLRENLRPMVVVTADHEGRDLGSVAADVAARLRGLDLSPGCTLELGGQVRAQQQTFADLTRVTAFGLLAVAIVLLAQFRRARLALAILASVPLAVVGALLTLAVCQVPLNASSAMGCVLLVGLVVKNGILLLEQAETIAARGTPLAAALVEAGTTRVRPILMTTVATIVGLLPLALGIGAGAELQRPLAVAVIGGLLTSTAVSLLIVPALVRLLVRDVQRVDT